MGPESTIFFPSRCVEQNVVEPFLRVPLKIENESFSFLWLFVQVVRLCLSS